MVEDDENIRSAVAYCLRRSGYIVLLSGDGSDAWARLHEKEISLVILDLSLPKMDGFQLLELLRAETELKGVASIILTAFEDEANRRRSYELGAKRFMTKPFSPRELVAAVGEVIGPPIADGKRRPPGGPAPGTKLKPPLAAGMGGTLTQAKL